MNLPRKSRHLDLTREEVSDAESRAEGNYRYSGGFKATAVKLIPCQGC
jgi:hypothetical protein